MNGSNAPYSLRRRLLLWLLVPLGLVAMLAMLDSYFNAQETATEAADRVLSGSVLAIADRVYVNDEGKLEADIPYVALDMLTSAAQDRVFYRVDGPGNVFVTGYHRLPVPETLEETEIAGQVQFTNAQFRQDAVRIAVVNGAASSGLNSIPYRVSVAETTVARQRLTREILIRSALRQLLLVVSAAIIVWLAVTRGLRPLHKLEAAIGRRSPDDLRPILHLVPQEVSGLVGRINDFMARLSGSIEALRHFTGNASHQIRTPLTIIRTQLTLANRAETLSEAKEALETCNIAISDAERMVSQLMLLARVDEQSSQALADAQIDLAALARSITMEFVPTAAGKGFDLGFEGPQTLSCKGEAVLVGELLRNLLDNAIKHAIGGDEITVRVRQQKQGSSDRIYLEVQDNGPGMSAEAFELAERFKSPSRPSGGAGLGLAIAKEIANLFDCSMTIAEPKGRRGTLVVIAFLPVGTLAEN